MNVNININLNSDRQSQKYASAHYMRHFIVLTDITSHCESLSTGLIWSSMETIYTYIMFISQFQFYLFSTQYKRAWKCLLPPKYTSSICSAN